MKKLYPLLIIALIGFVGDAQIITIPDANFKAKLISLGVDTNFDGNIQQSEALAKTFLYIDNAGIANLTGISSFSNLTTLSFQSNNITDLTPLNGLTMLNHLYCDDNQITSLLGLNSMTSLESISLANTPITSLSGITSFPNLESLGLYGCQQLTSISDITSLTHLDRLDISYAEQVSLPVINTLTNLEHLSCRGRFLTSLATFSNLTNLKSISIGNNNFTSLNLSYFPNLTELYCNENNISSLNLAVVPNLTDLVCFSNNLTSLNLSSVTNLGYLDCGQNHLTSLNITGLSHLQSLSCVTNNLTALDISGSPLLTVLMCSGNNLTTLDASNQHNLSHFECYDMPNLITLFIKNGSDYSDQVNGILIYNCPNLQYICADDFMIPTIQDEIASDNMVNCHVNSYCSFMPGGTFYTIQGNNHYDSNNNGCDASDLNYPNLKLTFANGVNSSTFFANSTGAYHYDVEAGTHSVTPTLENQAYFTISPANFTVDFPTNASPFMQNFCISPNGIHNDLEVAVYPLSPARPGFDSSYEIIYKNKGTQTQSGTVSLDYYDPIEDLVAANPNFSSETSNFMHTLNWSFSNLQPFESREITVVFNLNSPVESPAVNAGNGISYTAAITGAADETPNDNTSTLDQTVVNSFDPNDKTCTEGNYLPIYQVGKELHYIIRFENSGSANAQNIVVKDMIDTTKFDISTLVPLNGSHAFETKISETNKVEFIFQNINLPFDDAHNDGYVAFKIKTLPTLTEGQIINNTANIYFDYNAPIVTNTSTVNVFNPLATADFDFNSTFTLSPVPAKNSLMIRVKQDLIMSSVSIYNTLGQLVQVDTNPSGIIDVSGLKAGSYFIKIISDKGTAGSKFIKE